MNGSEVVDADHVKQAKHAFHAFLPPTPSLGSVGVPIVEHRPPLLAAFREVIRWHASDHLGHALIVELEQPSMGPDVCRIVRNEHRHVPDEGNTLLSGLMLHRLPRRLKPLLGPNMGSGLSSVGCQRFRFAVPERCRPFKPRPAVVVVLDGRIEAPIVQPVGIVGHDGFGVVRHQGGPSRERRW